jgi:transmembrane sensor
VSDPFDWRIIDRHLAGQASPSDDAELSRWLDADPRNAELLDQLSASVVDRQSSDGSFDVSAAWARLSGRLAGERPTRHLALDRAPGFAAPRRSLRRIGSAAAVIAAAVVVALVWRAPRAPSPGAPARAMREVASARAQQSHVTLRDGTRVVLNAGSRLRYAEDFGVASREVELDGEGYFEVVHDASRRFRVRTSGGIAEDLGTRFAVRAYGGGSPVQVVVAEGSVALARSAKDSARRAVLVPGQLGRVEPDGRVTVVSDVDVDRWVSWTRGALVLDGLSLADAAAEIGRRYDVRVIVPDAALARRRVSARFHDAPLPSVLDALVLALGAHWSNDGVAIVIRSAE